MWWLIEVIKNIYHFLFSFLAALFYRFPSRKIKVLGVTGTNGKTTTLDLTSRILKEAGFRVAAFSSVKFEIAGKEEQNLYKMTMPGRGVPQKLLRRAVKESCDMAVMEVTSEGIKQHRHRFIDFDAVCFTNLTPEHIESHGSFENYKREKAKLFKENRRTHIINIDDHHADFFLQFPAKEKILYGIKEEEKKEKEAHIVAENVEVEKDSVKFTWKKEEFLLNLSGRFNVYNALAAISFSEKEGLERETIRRAFQKVRVIPGRMEEVISSPFSVIIDYAVTPDTLEKVYSEIKESFSPRRMIAVLGSCGGGRDKWKRPVMGEVVSSYADIIFLTDEDPYEEDPAEIVSMIRSGIKRKGFKGEVHEILDRREAIGKAMEVAKEGDVVIVTGKGDEPWICISGGRKIPWNEREIIKEEYEKKGFPKNK